MKKCFLSILILSFCIVKSQVNDNTVFSSETLNDNTYYRRAVETAIWGMPIVAAKAIRDGYENDLGAHYNDIVYHSKTADWKFQTTTPNASTYYIYAAYNITKDGPIVIEVPSADGAGIYGQLCDMWDIPLAIVGPGGEDKGKGGKYLIIPENYNGKIPEGYFSVKQKTAGGFWLMRTIPKSKSVSDLNNAISLIKKIRVYPLSKAENPAKQRYIDASGKIWNGIPKMDETFYEVLAKMVNEEPVLSHDLAIMNMLRTLGIEKGKEYAIPDPKKTAMLKKAVNEVKQWFVNQLLQQLKPFWEGHYWALPDTSGIKTQFSYLTNEMLDYDNRGMLGFYGWAPPMKADESAPTIYIQSLKDKNGNFFEGGSVYRLRVPKNVPAKQYWSVTLYDFDTAGFIREAQVVSLDSYNKKTKKNSDGSIDIYFSEKAPAGQENNWVSTKKGRKWFPMFRLYGPDKAFFDKSWVMDDIEKMN